MKKIYPPEHFDCSKKFNLKEEFKALTELKIYPSEVNVDYLRNKEYHEVLCKELNITDPMERRRLREISHEKLLTVDGEDERKHDFNDGLRNSVKLKPPIQVNDNASDLSCVKARQMLKSQLTEIYSKHRYHADLYECETEMAKDTTVPPQIATPKDALCGLSIRIYHPFNFTYSLRAECRSIANIHTNLKFSQEILVLTSNTLAELRDCIKCYSDEGVCHEIENPSISHPFESSKKKYPSGFLFIDNVFYNDNRHSKSIDYSEVVRKWGAERDIKMDVGCMASTRIGELSLRFGYPYVYQHQGKCEHIFAFVDGWILNKKDNLNPEKYPICTSIHQPYSKLCSICCVEGAQWICVDSDRMPLNPMLLCELCFKSFNFVDGKKVGSFKAYPFFGQKIYTK
ncbi:hypothetical protein RI129_005258 [Pyrocoelia pectoralis]|uniref:snRNA-activating protein complex subunit 3 n=1 Tax=Pyrocoelia pectoralis TaxID=417401 RepID=A0AAN7VHY6_9COLE